VVHDPVPTSSSALDERQEIFDVFRSEVHVLKGIDCFALFDEISIHNEVMISDP
jgi:hypothetical protein